MWVDLIKMTKPGQERPAVQRIELGEVELLPESELRTRFLAPIHVGVRNEGLLEERVTGWLLRLDDGSKALRLGIPSTLVRPPHAGQETVAAGEAVQLERPYVVAAGRTQGFPLAFRAVELGRVSGRLVVLDGDDELGSIPFRGTVVPPGE